MCQRLGIQKVEVGALFDATCDSEGMFVRRRSDNDDRLHRYPKAANVNVASSSVVSYEAVMRVPGRGGPSQASALSNAWTMSLSTVSIVKVSRVPGVGRGPSCPSSLTHIDAQTSLSTVSTALVSNVPGGPQGTSRAGLPSASYKERTITLRLSVRAHKCSEAHPDGSML